MSCGKPHETDCSTLLAEIWLLVDDECTPDRKQKLKQHLDECGPCLEQYGIEEHLKLLLARKCGGEHAPDTFKERLRAEIRSAVLEQAEVTVERDASGAAVGVEVRHTTVEYHQD
ncbi:MAG TPA: mycothiol system anti-sigma-R factor [Pseudonocardiaceae bacterium]|nr:mycothiol system anti-sigma-R factor [Pseudonocardiaceae bacterium]